jgi:hypothetical protein
MDVATFHFSLNAIGFAGAFLVVCMVAYIATR